MKISEFENNVKSFLGNDGKADTAAEKHLRSILQITEGQHKLNGEDRNSIRRLLERIIELNEAYLPLLTDFSQLQIGAVEVSDFILCLNDAQRSIEARFMEGVDEETAEMLAGADSILLETEVSIGAKTYLTATEKELFAAQLKQIDIEVLNENEPLKELERMVKHVNEHEKTLNRGCVGKIVAAGLIGAGLAWGTYVKSNSGENIGNDITATSGDNSRAR